MENKLKKIEYVDELGRHYLMTLPDDAPDSEAGVGVPVGPPDVVDILDLGEPFATRLHNELYRNKLWTMNDVRRDTKKLFGILQRLLKVDVHRIIDAYAQLEKE